MQRKPWYIFAGIGLVPLPSNLKSRLMSLTRKRQTRRGRISLAKEVRIWQLRCQGYDLDTLARIVNSKPSTCGVAVSRARRHWMHQDDPRLGRKSGYLSDQEVASIRQRHAQGARIATLAREYDMAWSTMYNICRGTSYREPCGDQGYEFSFANRLVRQ